MGSHIFNTKSVLIDGTLNWKSKIFRKDYDMKSKYFHFPQNKVRKEDRDKKRLEHKLFADPPPLNRLKMSRFFVIKDI